MDNWVILARTHWQPRRAIKLVKQTLSELKIERLTRLYEHGEPTDRIGDYVRSWQHWTVSGLGAYRNSISGLAPNACGAIA